MNTKRLHLLGETYEQGRIQFTEGRLMPQYTELPCDKEGWRLLMDKNGIVWATTYFPRDYQNDTQEKLKEAVLKILLEEL